MAEELVLTDNLRSAQCVFGASFAETCISRAVDVQSTPFKVPRICLHGIPEGFRTLVCVWGRRFDRSEGSN